MVETSTDGVKWTRTHDGTGSLAKATDEHAFAAVEARYSADQLPGFIGRMGQHSRGDLVANKHRPLSNRILEMSLMPTGSMAKLTTRDGASFLDDIESLSKGK